MDGLEMIVITWAADEMGKKIPAPPGDDAGQC